MKMAELAQVAQGLRSTISAGSPDRRRLDDALVRIREIDAELGRSSSRRSRIHAEARLPRTTAGLLTTINILVAVALVLLRNGARARRPDEPARIVRSRAARAERGSASSVRAVS